MVFKHPPSLCMLEMRLALLDGRGSNLCSVQDWCNTGAKQLVRADQVIVREQREIGEGHDDAVAASAALLKQLFGHGFG